MIKVVLLTGESFDIPGDLKPCPYCGNKNLELIAGGNGFYVSCNVYACNSPYSKLYKKAMDAVEAWNNEN